MEPSRSRALPVLDADWYSSKKGEGGDKGGDSSLYLGWRLEVEEGWRNEAGRVLSREQWIVGGGLGRIRCIKRRHVLTIQEWMEEGGDGVVRG